MGEKFCSRRRFWACTSFGASPALGFMAFVSGAGVSETNQDDAAGLIGEFPGLAVGGRQTALGCGVGFWV